MEKQTFSFLQRLFCDEDTRRKWVPRLALIGAALILVSLFAPLGGKAPQGKALIGHSPVLGALLALAAIFGAAKGLTRGPWGLALAGVFLVVMGRVVFGEFYFGRPTADPGYHINPFRVPGYGLFYLGCFSLLGSFLLMMYRRLAGRMAAKSAAYQKANPEETKEAAREFQEGPIEADIVGRWRLVAVDGHQGAAAPSGFLNAVYEFRPDGKLKMKMWGFGRTARYERDGRQMRVKLPRQWPAHKWTILSLDAREMVARNDTTGGRIMRLTRL